jgi:hypothetical protein
MSAENQPVEMANGDTIQAAIWRRKRKWLMVISSMAKTHEIMKAINKCEKRKCRGERKRSNTLKISQRNINRRGIWHLKMWRPGWWHQYSETRWHQLS